MHPRPKATKRARVSFDPDLDVVTESLTIEGGLATGLQGGGWGGHWPTRVEIPQPTTGKGKEAMEDPADSQLIQDVTQPAGMIDPPRRQRGKRKHTGHYRKSGARAPNENTF